MPYLKVIKAGDLTEIYEYERSIEYHGKNIRRKRQRPKNARTDGGTFSVRRVDNIFRLKRRFVRLVRANVGTTEKPALLTLTMHEVLGVKLSYNAFNVFIQRLRARTKAVLRYIAVVEFQKRGAVHFHVLMWGLSDHIISDERNNRFLQNLWRAGFADCIPTDGSPRLAGYLSKYLSKSMFDQRLSSEKAYTASRNIMRPLSSTYEQTFDDVSDWIVPQNASLLQNRGYMTKWLGEGRYRLYKQNN